MKRAPISGRDQLCHSEGAEVQPGDADLPPVAGPEAGLRTQLLQ